jgi:hypothetical protein
LYQDKRKEEKDKTFKGQHTKPEMPVRRLYMPMATGTGYTIKSRQINLTHFQNIPIHRIAAVAMAGQTVSS